MLMFMEVAVSERVSGVKACLRISTYFLMKNYFLMR